MPNRVRERRPDLERFEVRRVIKMDNGWARCEPVSWHRKRDRAIAVAEKTPGETRVVWTHPDDKYLSHMIDDAMVVWSSRHKDTD